MFEPAELENAVQQAPDWIAALSGSAGFQSDTRFEVSNVSPGIAPQQGADVRQTELDEAFERGRAQGHSEAEELAGKQTAERRRLGSSLRRMDEEMTQELGRHLSETIVALCEATLAPLALDRELLAERCRKAARLLGDTHNDRILRLNPADIDALEEGFRQSWNITPDPDLPQGALRIEYAGGGISDGPGQWRAALAETLGLARS